MSSAAAIVLGCCGPKPAPVIVTSNDEERPFNRDQRRWVYASRKRQNDCFAFGADDDLELVSEPMLTPWRFAGALKFQGVVLETSGCFAVTDPFVVVTN
ncbi:MAG: hypothetical protein U1E73_11655 [Planctomycetota bacterium]